MTGAPTAVRWRLGAVLEVIEETPHAKTIVLEVPDWPGHVAGQHVDIRLTAGDGYQTGFAATSQNGSSDAGAVTLCAAPTSSLPAPCSAAV